MRTILSLILVTLSLNVFFSCTTEDACADIQCLNDATCNDGTCECILGFEGTTCETEALAKFIGTYILDSETCGNFETNFEIVAVPNSLIELTQLIESNNGGTFEVSGMLDSANSFINSSGSITSVYSAGTLEVTIDGCIGTYIKQ